SKIISRLILCENVPSWSLVFQDGGGLWSAIPVPHKSTYVFYHHCTLDADSRHARDAVQGNCSSRILRPSEALLNITEVTSEEDAECSFAREGWQCDDSNHAGMDWFKSICGHNTSILFGLFKKTSRLLLLACGYHLRNIRGTRRLGISKGNSQMVMKCVHRVIEACGVTLKQQPNVEAVDEES
ncbi:hypothetical protein N7517_010029, partial [Penicillium concentricum]